MSKEPTLRSIESNVSDLRVTVFALDKKVGALDKRFDAMDKKFGAMDKRFDAMDKRFDVMDKRFDVMDKRFDAMDKKFEGRFDELYKNARVTGERIGTLEERFDDLMAFLKENMPLKSEVVTKEDVRIIVQELRDHTDRMIGKTRGDTVALIRQTSAGTTELVNTLYDHQTLSADDKVRLIAMQPFPPSQSR